MQVYTQFTDELSRLWHNAYEKETKKAPFSLFSWHATWFRHFGNKETLTIVTHHDVIIPLSIHEKTAHFTGGEEFADYLDAIGPGEQKEEAWKEALQYLQDQHVQTLHVRNIPKNTATLSFFEHDSRATIGEEDTTPLLILPASLDAYLSNLPRKDRHEFKRKMKRFEEDHPNNLYEVTSEFDPELLFTLMKQNPDKAEFLTPRMEAFFRDLPQASGNTLRQATLRVDDTPVATTIFFVSGSELLLYNSGYNGDMLGAGWYSKARLIPWCIDNKITMLNYLQGNERYKYDFGAIDSPVYSVTVQLS